MVTILISAYIPVKKAASTPVMESMDIQFLDDSAYLNIVQGQRTLCGVHYNAVCH